MPRCVAFELYGCETRGRAVARRVRRRAAPLFVLGKAVVRPAVRNAKPVPPRRTDPSAPTYGTTTGSGGVPTRPPIAFLRQTFGWSGATTGGCASICAIPRAVCFARFLSSCRFRTRTTRRFYGWRGSGGGLFTGWRPSCRRTSGATCRQIWG